MGFLDDGLGDGDAGVAGGAEGLDLGDGHGALVVVAPLGFGSVVPAAAAGLGVSTIGDRAGEDVLELFAALTVFLIAVDGGEEEHAEAVAVHVAGRFRRIVRVADEAVAIAVLLAFLHEPVGGAADVLGILAFANGAAFHEQGHTGRLAHPSARPCAAA